MNALTLGQLRTTIARAVGICSTDSRVVDYINEAQQRLIYKGDWTGVFMRYRICSNESCLVWPRQIQTIEAVALCNTPGKVRNEWFEFNGVGPGLQDDEDNIGRQLIDHGTSVAFDWVRGTGKKIRVYAMHSSDAGKTITLRYYNDSGQKVYTQIDGTWQEGEEITLVAPPAYAVTTQEVMQQGLYGVVKDVTNQPVILYEFDGADNTRTLAQYEPTETNPIYRVSMIPDLADYGACDGSTTACEKTTVTVMARVRHVPVVVDNDPLVLGNTAAFKLMALAIKEEEARNDQRSVLLEQRALGELEFELRSQLGQGPVVVPRFQSPALFGGGGVESLVNY